MPSKKPPFSLAPLVPWRALPRPIPWDRVFRRAAPLSVELGFGLGDYLVRTAVANPGINFVGVEIDWFLIRRTLQKLTAAGATNVALVQADASIALERLFSEHSIEKIWAMFPCPWPKARHAGKRLFSRSFLLLVNSRLVPAGDAFVVTDDRDHALWIRDESVETGFHVHDEIVPPRFATCYEKKWEKKGQDHFYKVHFQKETHISVPQKEEARLQARIVPSFCREDLTSQPMKGHATVVPKETLYDPVQGRAMMRSLIIETDFVQDIWIEIVHKPTGWHIRPAKGCAMVPTPGVQEALDLLQERLLTRRDDRPLKHQPV